MGQVAGPHGRLAAADADVVFALLDPFLFQPEYSFEMTDADAAALGLRRPDEAIVRVILTLRESAAAITAGLSPSRAAISSASARPILRAPPVMTTTLPANSCVLLMVLPLCFCW